MGKLFRVLFCAIIVDFFYYSSVFSFTMGQNTKLILGVMGLATFIITSVRKREFNLSREMVLMTIIAAGVSLASYVSMSFNNTGDNAYLTYVISMLVWLSAAYMVIRILRYFHGEVTIDLVANYIIAISVVQCAIAITANMNEPFNLFIKTIFPGTGWLDSVDRMYGLGDTTALDTGGIRYSIACVFCAYMLVRVQGKKDGLIPWYLFAYMVITVIGNMIARTTTVGAGLALVYMMVFLFISAKVSYSKLKTLGWLVAILAVVVGILSWLYNTNDIIHNNLRFGFEGFFSLVETGHWQVNSNDRLSSMYVFPDNAKTWIIGDGYFNNPYSDPNFLGEVTGGYYMDTDVGYLRFIFYFGVVGLVIFAAMILYAGKICRMRYPKEWLLFYILVLINFIIWFKVATDCFFILGMFIAMAYVRDYMEVPERFQQEIPEETEEET